MTGRNPTAAFLHNGIFIPDSTAESSRWQLLILSVFSSERRLMVRFLLINLALGFHWIVQFIKCQGMFSKISHSPKWHLQIASSVQPTVETQRLFIYLHEWQTVSQFKSLEPASVSCFCLKMEQNNCSIIKNSWQLLFSGSSNGCTSTYHNFSGPKGGIFKIACFAWQQSRRWTHLIYGDKQRRRERNSHSGEAGSLSFAGMNISSACQTFIWKPSGFMTKNPEVQTCQLIAGSKPLEDQHPFTWQSLLSSILLLHPPPPPRCGFSPLINDPKKTSHRSQHQAPPPRVPLIPH